MRSKLPAAGSAFGQVPSGYSVSGSPCLRASVFRLRRSVLAAVGIAAAVTALAALLQWIWAGWSVYSGPGPSLAMRWLLTGAAGAALLLPPGAAMIGAAVGRRIADAGLRDQVRVTQRGARNLALRATRWALAAPLLVVGISAGGWTAASLVARGSWGGGGDLPGPTAIGVAHAVTMGVAAAFAVWGLALAVGERSGSGSALGSRLRAGVVTRSGVWSLFGMAALVAGPALVGPLLSHLTRPEWALNGALLVNPVTAVGAALGMDVLRSPHVYGLTKAPEYWYTYPPAMATVGVYLALTTVGAARLQRLLERGNVG